MLYYIILYYIMLYYIILYYILYIGTAGSLFVCGQKTLSETIGEFWWDYNKQLQKLLGKLLGTIRKIVI